MAFEASAKMATVWLQTQIPGNFRAALCTDSWSRNCHCLHFAYMNAMEDVNMLDVEVEDEEVDVEAANINLATDEDLPNPYVDNFKSKQKYINQFLAYKKWKEENNIPEDNNKQKTLLNYFKTKLDAGKKVATLWSYRSMLMPFFLQDYNINLESYDHLTYLLKTGKRKKEAPVRKASVFDEEDLQNFLELETEDPEIIRDKVLFAISWFCFPRVANWLNSLLKISVGATTDTWRFSSSDQKPTIQLIIRCHPFCLANLTQSN